MFNSIKSFCIGTISFLSCLMINGCIIKHEQSLSTNFELVYTANKMLCIAIDIRKEPDEFIAKHAIHLPYHQDLAWEEVLQAAKSKNKDNFSWLLYVYADNKMELKVFEKRLKRGCKFKKMPLRYPNAVYYVLDDID